MNDSNRSPPVPNDDPLLEEMLSPLKRLEPPLETRITNRQAVSAALGSFHAVNRHLPWWRRSVSIPVPFAAALGLLLAVASYGSFRNWQERPPLRVAQVSQPAEATTGSGKSTLANGAADTQPTLKYYETETYLCGVGRVNSESFYVNKD